MGGIDWTEMNRAQEALNKALELRYGAPRSADKHKRNERAHPSPLAATIQIDANGRVRL